MHAVLPRKELLGLVKTASIIAKNGDLRPILRNVLVEASKSAVELSATDLTVSLWLKIPAAPDRAVIHSEGKALVSALRLMRVLNSAASETVTLKMDNKLLIVTSGKAIFRLVTEDADDFPKIPRFSSRGEFATVSAKITDQLISRTAYCAHTERSHYNMHGVLIKTGNSSIEMAATNGQRLAVGKAPIISTSTTPLTKQAIVPSSSVWAISKITALDENAKIDIQWMSRGLNIRGEKGEAMLLALNGSFPPYQRGIPKNKNYIELNRKKLIEVLKQTNAIGDNTTTAFVDLTLNENKMKFESMVQDSGTANVVCEALWEHDPVTFVINPEFLIKAATSMSGEQIRLEVEGSNTPTLLREQGDGVIESCCVFAVARR